MTTTEPQAYRHGQHVRITECPQNHPDHVGQVGTVATHNTMRAALRVYVGMGICQATAVEPVDEPASIVRRQAAGVVTIQPPKFRRLCASLPRVDVVAAG